MTGEKPGKGMKGFVAPFRRERCGARIGMLKLNEDDSRCAGGKGMSR